MLLIRYHSGDRFKKNEIDVVLAVERRGTYRTFVGKPEGKRPLERLKLRSDDNIKIDFQEVGRDGLDLSG